MVLVQGVGGAAVKGNAMTGTELQPWELGVVLGIIALWLSYVSTSDKFDK